MVKVVTCRVRGPWSNFISIQMLLVFRNKTWGGANGNVKLFCVSLLRIKKNLVSATKLLPGAITDLNDHNLRHKIEKNWKFQANYKKPLIFSIL